MGIVQCPPLSYRLSRVSRRLSASHHARLWKPGQQNSQQLKNNSSSEAMIPRYQPWHLEHAVSMMEIVAAFGLAFIAL